MTAYDLLGRVSIVTDPMARKTFTEYSPDCLVQVITQAHGTSIERDARTNAYNGNGELLSVLVQFRAISGSR